jgi:hypothetical protein
MVEQDTFLIANASIVKSTIVLFELNNCAIVNEKSALFDFNLTRMRE